MTHIQKMQEMIEQVSEDLRLSLDAMSQSSCGCGGYLPDETKNIIITAIARVVRETEEINTKSVTSTIRRKMHEWNTQTHLRNFDRTLSHNSGIACGYSAAVKALDNLLSGIEVGAPLDDVAEYLTNLKNETG